MWEVRKEILGWIRDGATQCIELLEKKQEEIYQETKTLVQMRNGIPFKCFEKLMSGLHHAAIGISQGKSLFGPINRLITMKSHCII